MDEAVRLGLLGRPVEGWPALRIRFAAAGEVPETLHIGDNEAVVPLRILGGSMELERASGEVTICRDEPFDVHDLVHPAMAWAAVVNTVWRDELCFHGGAVVGANGAWLVLAPKEGGKSTALAHLAAAGYPVLADDVIVLRDGHVCAGPRSIDLRPEAADRWDGPDLLQVREQVGGRGRLVAPPVPDLVPLAGIIHLWFGDELVVADVAPSARLARLAKHRSLWDVPIDERAFLTLAPLPAVDLVRPKDWSTFDAAFGEIRARIGAPPATPHVP